VHSFEFVHHVWYGRAAKVLPEPVLDAPVAPLLLLVLVVVLLLLLPHPATARAAPATTAAPKSIVRRLRLVRSIWAFLHQLSRASTSAADTCGAAVSGSSVTSAIPANVKMHIINCELLVNAGSPVGH